METKIGPIQPHLYGMKGDKKVNYFRGGDKHYCRISHEGLHLMLDDGWYTNKLLADLDPADALGKNKREYIKEILDGIDWDDLGKYPNSAVGANLEDLITPKAGSVECYHSKLNGMTKESLKLIWRGEIPEGMQLLSQVDNNDGKQVPAQLITADDQVLVEFDWELIYKRGFRLVNWWALPNRSEVHVTIAHLSTFD